jgi:endonuclease III
VIDKLREFYGLQPTPPADLFQFFVWEILSRDALPARRDLAWLALKKIPALTPDAMFRAPAKTLLDAVGLTGPYREEKVERIRATVGEFKRHREHFYGDALQRAGVLRAARALGKFSHLELEIRQRAQLFASRALVLPIDDEISRVVNRLLGDPEPVSSGRGQRPAREKNRYRRQARRWLMERLPSHVDAYRDAVIYLRHHAQHTCVVIGPHCNVCPLRLECRSVQGGNTTP